MYRKKAIQEVLNTRDGTRSELKRKPGKASNPLLLVMVPGN